MTAAEAVAVHDPKRIGPRLIGLCGFAGSGKTSVAKCLERQGYSRLRFAELFKLMIHTLLCAQGVSSDQAQRMIDGDLKDIAQPALEGQTPRHALQTLGTDWGCKLIGPDIWTNVTMRSAEAILSRGGKVVIDDVRMEREAAAIRGTKWQNMTGARELWMVQGRGGIPGNHPSENDPARLLPDLILHNDQSSEHLERLVLEEILG